MKKTNPNANPNYLKELQILCDHIYRAKSKVRAIRKPTYYTDIDRTSDLTRVHEVLDEAKNIVLRLFEKEALLDNHKEIA